jgi:N-acetylmuramoyl-L-alanine amidase
VLPRYLKTCSAWALWCLCAFFTCAAASHAADAPRAAGKPFIVVLDPGHTPKQPGALGVKGIYEVTYNDALCAKLAKALEATGVQVVFTRAPTEEISLDGRAALANARQANLFLALHHDSAQLKYLTKTEFNGIPAYQTIQPIAGYSIFVSQLNPKFAQSQQFAKLLGQALLTLGRHPTLHHAEPIAGENRELLDAHLGIYKFDELLVLRKTTVPAVLLEVGVIVDAEDEKYVADNAKQDAIVHAIAAAVEKFSMESAQLQN